MSFPLEHLRKVLNINDPLTGRVKGKVFLVQFRSLPGADTHFYHYAVKFGYQVYAREKRDIRGVRLQGTWEVYVQGIVESVLDTITALERAYVWVEENQGKLP